MCCWFMYWPKSSLNCGTLGRSVGASLDFWKEADWCFWQNIALLLKVRGSQVAVGARPELDMGICASINTSSALQFCLGAAHLVAVSTSSRWKESWHGKDWAGGLRFLFYPVCHCDEVQMISRKAADSALFMDVPAGQLEVVLCNSFHVRLPVPPDHLSPA